MGTVGDVFDAGIVGALLEAFRNEDVIEAVKQLGFLGRAFLGELQPKSFQTPIFIRIGFGINGNEMIAAVYSVAVKVHIGELVIHFLLGITDFVEWLSRAIFKFAAQSPGVELAMVA